MCSLSAGRKRPQSGHVYVAGFRFCARRIDHQAARSGPRRRLSAGSARAGRLTLVARGVLALALDRPRLAPALVAQAREQ